MSASTKRVLVLLSTGKQGRAVVETLAATSSPSSYKVLALTRNKESPIAQRLAKHSNVELLQGSTNTDKDALDVFTCATQSSSQKIDALVVILQGVDNPEGIHHGEITQARRIFSLAKQFNVPHIVYSSVEFGTQADTGAPHVESKRQIEKLLQEDFANAHKGNTYTILRPTALFENMQSRYSIEYFVFKTQVTNETFEIDLQSAAFTITLLTKLITRPLYWISTKDIAYFVKQSIDDPKRFDKRVIALAGDLIDREKFTQIWTSNGLPEQTLNQVPEAAVLNMLNGNPAMKQMNQYLNTHGYQADIAELRKEHPKLLDLHAWLEQNKALFVAA